LPSVLLVECHEELASDIATRLRDIGYDVTAAYDTLAALDVLNTRAWFDVLVTRVRMCRAMPHGFALARIALSRRPHLRVIYLTRFEVPETESQTAGSPILTAPFSAEDVVREVIEFAM
jgi:CheY-like chemotaxis protein